MSAGTEKDYSDEFGASNSEIMRNAMKARRIASDMPHLTPILDALPNGSIVCEVGCGPGGMTLDIAQRYPGLQVLGMDIDKESIKQASEAARAAGVNNIRYAVGDAVELQALAAEPGFEAIKGGCDLVYSHAAIMHTGDPLEATKQLSLAVKPGGTISMAEGDMDLFFAYPESPGMSKFLEIFPKLGAPNGGDARMGRKLLSHLLAAGHCRDDITDIQLSAQILSRPEQRQGVAGGFHHILGEVMAKPEWMKACQITEADVDLIRKDLAEWAKCEGGILSFPSVYVVCKKAK